MYSLFQAIYIQFDYKNVESVVHCIHLFIHEFIYLLKNTNIFYKLVAFVGTCCPWRWPKYAISVQILRQILNKYLRKVFLNDANIFVLLCSSCWRSELTFKCHLNVKVKVISRSNYKKIPGNLRFYVYYLLFKFLHLGYFVHFDNKE